MKTPELSINAPSNLYCQTISSGLFTNLLGDIDAHIIHNETNLIIKLYISFVMNHILQRVLDFLLQFILWLWWSQCHHMRVLQLLSTIPSRYLGSSPWPLWSVVPISHPEMTAFSVPSPPARFIPTHIWTLIIISICHCWISSYIPTHPPCFPVMEMIVFGRKYAICFFSSIHRVRFIHNYCLVRRADVFPNPKMTMGISSSFLSIS